MSNENQKAKILVVDDEIVIATDLRNRVSELGYTAIGPATRGESALRAIEQERPDLILMDISLGDGMDGIEAARIIGDRFDTPVIFITAYADEERLKQAKLTRPFGYIIKPFRDRDLKITIEMALHLAKVEAKRKQVEESLRVFQQMVDSSPDAMSFVGRDYVYRTVNDAYLRRYDLPREKIEGKPVAELMGQRVFDEVVKPRLDRCLAGELVTYEDWFDYGPLGRKCMEVIYSPCRDGASKVIGITAAIRDITDRKQTEEALRVSAESHRTTLMTAMDGFWITDLEGRLLQVNESYCKMSGYSESELLSMNISDLDIVETPADTSNHMQRVMSWGQDRFETRHRRKDGCIIDVEISVSIPSGRGWASSRLSA